MTIGLHTPAHAQKPAKADTLYLRDGSVLTGIVLQDSAGYYYIYNDKCGKLAVKEKDVLYTAPRAAASDSVTESYILIDESSDAISTLQRALPDRADKASSFTLLVPGCVENVRDGVVCDIPFESSEIAGASRVTIRYRDISARAERLYLTTRQEGLVNRDESGAVRFALNYTLDRAGTIRIIVKFPDEWRIESASPDPARRFEGLIVWEQPLRRQQRFAPSLTFRLAEGKARRQAAGTDAGEESETDGR